jgi:hypothetical protein
LCLAACAVYGLNRWVLKPSFDAPFLHGTFNDLLLIPAALPWVLWAQHKLGWRKSNHFPTPGEILGHLIVWSVIAEGIMPRLNPRFTADWWDVVAYSLGAAGAAAIWMACARKSGYR